MTRLFSLAFKSLAGLFAIIVILAGLAFWRISTQTMSSTTWTPYIEAAVARMMPGTHAKIAQTSFEWDNRKHTLALTCEDVKLLDHNEIVVARFPSASLKLGLWSLLSGRVLPIEMTADGAEFSLVREKDGDLTLGGIKTSDAAEVSVEGIDVISFLQDIADELANTRLTHAITIKDVTVRVHDLSVKQNWSVKVPEITLDHDHQSATGQAKIEVAQGARSSTVQASYAFDRPHKLHNVTLAFQDIRLPFLASQHPKLQRLSAIDLPISGSVTFGTDRDLNFSAAKVDLESGEGSITETTLWEKPRKIAGIKLSAVYNKPKETMEITSANIDFGGPKLGLQFSARMPTVRDLLWLHNRKSSPFTLSATLQNVPMDQFSQIWPIPVIPNARSWIVANMTKGMFTSGDVTVRGHLSWDDLENVTVDTGGGKIAARDGRISYLDGMPPVDVTGAEATFDLNKMDVKILGGGLGAIKIQPFTIQMTGFSDYTQYITIPLKIVGPVRDVLKLIDSPPLGYAKAVGLRTDDGEGQVEGQLTLHMPMLNDLLVKDIDVKADARLTDFAVRKLIPGIEATQGALQLNLTTSGFSLNGPVALNKVPSQLTWTSRFSSEDSDKPLHEAQVTAVVKTDQWAGFGLPETAKIEGETPVSVRYANVRKGFSTLNLQANLKGSAVHFEDLGWTKPAAQTAQLSVALEMPEGKNISLKSIELQGQGLKVRGSAEISQPEHQLVQLSLRPFVMGRSNATVRFSQTSDPTGLMKFSVEGESFDVSGFRGNKEPGKRDPRPKDYTIKLNKLYTSEKGFLANVQGNARRNQAGWAEIKLYGLAQGLKPVEIQLVPLNGKRTFSMLSDDFGLAMQGLGFSDTIKGGALSILGESLPENPNVISGKVKIGAFSVADLPVLARLLNAASPFGFADLITGEASFDHVRGYFKWHGDEIELNKFRAAGSIFGLNVDGRVDMNNGAANLNGTLVPFSFMNSIIGAIPVLGDVITGGDGQGVIAAAFTVKGSLNEPNISVNPVSLLTPGFLRTIFFSGEDNADEHEEEKGAQDMPLKPLKPIEPKPVEPKTKKKK